MASIRFISPQGKLVKQKSRADKRKVGKVWEYRMQMQFRTGKKDNKRRQWFPDLPDIGCLAAAEAYVAKETGRSASVGSLASWEDCIKAWKIKKKPSETYLSDVELTVKKIKEEFNDRYPAEISKTEMSGWLREKADKFTREDIPTADLDDYIEAIKDEKLRLPFLMMLFTGERNTAICELKWENVKSDRFYITQKGEKLREILTTPVIDKILNQAKQLAGKHDNPTSTVFFNKKLTPWNKSTLVKALGRAFKKATLEHRTPHELRHTFTTRLLEQGFSPIAVAAARGDENINSQTSYTHLHIEQAHKAMLGIEKMFGGIAEKHLDFKPKPKVEKTYKIKCDCGKIHNIKASELDKYASQVRQKKP
jgi:integrase